MRVQDPDQPEPECRTRPDDKSLERRKVLAPNWLTHRPRREDVELNSWLRRTLAVVSVASAVGLLGASATMTSPAPTPYVRPAAVGGPVEALATTVTVATLADSLVLEPAGPDRAAEQTDPAVRSELVIGRNETFYDALRASDAPHEDIMAIVAACREFRDLGRVRRGDRFWIYQHPDGGLARLGFDLDEESWVEFRREGDSYVMDQGSYPVERRRVAVAGRITRSLYESLQEAGAPLQLAPKMNDVFGWEIDFHRDLREGDVFRIVYEEVWKNDRYLRTGPILAAECINRGHVHRAFRFADSEGHSGYYDAEGKNLQKQLMRAPLEYSRISSGFSYRRFHPILKRWMPHLGVDYAAPVGTPVWAAGDGVVTEIGRKHGNGRYVRIRHTNQEYESWYLHLSRFASGLRRGSRVSQGEVIGYVGATGYATGPHLDFRIQRNGRWVNPRRLELPPAAPISAEHAADFEALAHRWDATLGCVPESCGPTPVWSLAQAGPPRIEPSGDRHRLRPPAVLSLEQPTLE
jgi:murein DD-endopeptidase MepM/ murein hydrolase activator NlpD